MESFGTLLRNLRLLYFVKQESLAFDLGCTEAAVSLWEADQRLPSTHLLAELIAQLVKVDVPADKIKALLDAYCLALTSRRTSQRLCAMLRRYAISPVLRP